MTTVNIPYRPLQRMVVGMAIAGLAFVVAGFVELKIEADADLLKPGQSKVVITNTIQGPITVTSPDFNGTINEVGDLFLNGFLFIIYTQSIIVCIGHSLMSACFFLMVKL